jgi:ubiquinone/menaquinone biosynthesis C-methylase UbiE
MEQRAHAETSRFDFGPLAHEYDRWYETPAGRAHDRVQKADVRRVLRAARAGERLLDVGCGTGHWSSFFKAMGYDVHGIDVSPEMIAVAQGCVPDCNFEVADACALPFEDASFHVVAAMTTLEFVADAARAVEEMARCTRPGGSMLVGTLNKLAPLNRRRVSKGEPPYASGHLFSPEELRNLLSPWGSVRMVASAPCFGKARSLVSTGVAGLSPTQRGRLRGAFVVAEVRR